jgi:HPt (histidine-containing phosphotransfer) domain-containing protein
MRRMHGIEDEPGDQVDEATPPRLVRQGGERLLHAVTRAFLDRWDSRLAELEEALASGDLAEAGRLAHGLRSSCDLVGAARLGRACGAVEALADAGALREARESAGPLHSTFEEVRPWIEAHAGR